MQHFPFAFQQFQNKAVLPAGSRVSKVPGFGYNVNPSALKRVITPYSANGGIPEMLHDASLSVNYNLIPFSDIISTNSTWNILSNVIQHGPINGMYEFTYASPSFASIETFTNSVPVIPGKTYTHSFSASMVSGTPISSTCSVIWKDSGGLVISTITGSPVTFDSIHRQFSSTYVAPALASSVVLRIPFDQPGTPRFRLSKIQLSEGGVVLPWRPRQDATVVKNLTIGKDVTTDATYVGGSPLVMTTIDPVSGLAYKFDTTLSQAFDTTLSQYQSTVTYMCWMKKTTDGSYQFFSGNGSGAIGFWVSATNKFVISKSYVSDFFVGTFTVPNNVWQHIAFTYSSTNTFMIYQNGVQVESIVSVQTWTPRLLQLCNNANGSFPTWVQDKISYANTVLTATQIVNIFNAQKSQYGL
jgi:hypothetical protein